MSEQNHGADVVAGTAIEVPDDSLPTPGNAVAVIAPHHGAIIAGEKPSEILEKAGAIAAALKDLIQTQKLARNLGGNRDHVEVGGWQACGALLGALGGQPLHAETRWTRKVADADGQPVRVTYTAVVKRFYKRDQGGGLREETTYDVDGYDWEAHVEILTPSRVVVGSADAMCGRGEMTWAKRDDYALRSMAETRAESRAYRRAVGWLVNIAGYSATPAEEMGGGEAVPAAGPPFGEAANDKLLEQTRRAVAYVLGADDPLGEQVGVLLGLLEKDGEGYLPRISARAVGQLAATLKASRPEPASAPAEAPVAPAAASEPAAQASGSTSPATAPAMTSTQRATLFEKLEGESTERVRAVMAQHERDDVREVAYAVLEKRGSSTEPSPADPPATPPAAPDPTPPAASEAAAQDPPSPDYDPRAAGRSIAAAGTVPLPELPSANPVKAMEILRAAGCTCPSPLEPESATTRDTSCPLTGHGIPW
ncbi:MAG: hypothetical protein WKF96_00015 [Solirubrobacteraceae bacterium]